MLEERIIQKLTKLHMTVTTVESCTGGMVSAALTSVPGSSAVFYRGFVTYCDQAKNEMVGVSRKTLEQYTAVSRETAKEMAEGGAKQANADFALSVTGYAGPDTGSGEPVGLVYIGCCFRGDTVVEECHFSGDRQEIRRQSLWRALELLERRITSFETVS